MYLNAVTQKINFVQWELKQRHSALCETVLAFLQARRLLFMMSGMSAFSWLKLAPKTDTQLTVNIQVVNIVV